MLRRSLFILAFISLAVQASWFGGSNEPIYKSWKADQLKAWLEIHNVPHSEYVSESDLRRAVQDNWNSASAWTYDQYHLAQNSFADLRESVFDSWDESQLRQFLLEHGVVSPKGSREYLLLLAKHKYNAYNTAASSFSSIASSSVYGGGNQATKSLESVVSRASTAAVQATKEVTIKFDESKDYVYSTWDENQLRSWLVKKGLLKSKEKKTKEELVQMLHNAWGRVSTPVWESWSDTYIRHWLIDHNIIKPDTTSTREVLSQNMKTYYYSTGDAVYDSWSDSELHKWLVDHEVIKSEAQVKREKMLQIIQNYYVSANDTFWNAWSDNQIRDWLVDHGYLRSETQVKRDELVKLANEKWNDVRAKSAAYLTWPDARLRAYLRENGVDDKFLPTSRPDLLQETRIRWVQSQTRADNVLAKVKEVINSGIYRAEDTLSYLLNLLSGGWEETKDRTAGVYERAKNHAAETRDRVLQTAAAGNRKVTEEL